jgi:nucleolar protein 58
LIAKPPVAATAAPPSGKGATLSAADLARLAQEAGISVVKFKRKFERGDVQLNDDGSVRVFSKKEMKKIRKAEEQVSSIDAQPTQEATGSKRKRDEEEEPVEKRQKRKKKDKMAAVA